MANAINAEVAPRADRNSRFTLGNVAAMLVAPTRLFLFVLTYDVFSRVA